MRVYTDKHRIPFEIDADDYYAVSRYSWRIATGYPTTHIGKKAKREGRCMGSLRLHEFLLGPAPEGMEWDHRDRDKLNNRRGNLRAATHETNMRNVNLLCTNRSGFKGVYRHKAANRWAACIGIGGRRTKHLGLFDTVEAAAAARKAAEVDMWGSQP